MAIAQGQFTILDLTDNGQTFTSQPTTPYFSGDVWYSGINGDILTCTVTRLEGEFHASDWAKLNKYTDDTTANANTGEINTLKTWKIGADTAIANVTQKATDNEAEINGITQWQGETVSSITQLQQKSDIQGGMIQGMVADIQRYCIGEYSQASGLSKAEALSMLPEGMTFVPTSITNKIETYTDPSAPLSTTFVRGHYYVWSGTSWTDAGANTVLFSDTYPVNSDISYWVPTTDVVIDDTTYNEGCLYKWKLDIDLPSPNSQGFAILDGESIV